MSQHQKNLRNETKQNRNFFVLFIKFFSLGPFITSIPHLSSLMSGHRMANRNEPSPSGSVSAGDCAYTPHPAGHGRGVSAGAGEFQQPAWCRRHHTHRFRLKCALCECAGDACCRARRNFSQEESSFDLLKTFFCPINCKKFDSFKYGIFNERAFSLIAIFAILQFED